MRCEEISSCPHTLPPSQRIPREASATGQQGYSGTFFSSREPCDFTAQLPVEPESSPGLSRVASQLPVPNRIQRAQRRILLAKGLSFKVGGPVAYIDREDTRSHHWSLGHKEWGGTCPGHTGLVGDFSFPSSLIESGETGEVSFDSSFYLT